MQKLLIIAGVLFSLTLAACAKEEAPASTTEKAAAKAVEVKDAVVDKTKAAGEAIEETAEDAMDAAEEGLEDAEEGMEDAAEAVEDAAAKMKAK